MAHQNFRFNVGNCLSIILTVIFLLGGIFSPVYAQEGIITTVAGNSVGSYNGGFSGDGGPATAAQLDSPWDITIDTVGNLYIVDLCNQRIRKVDTVGIISTVAGSGPVGLYNGGFSGDGGAATSAQLNTPCYVAADHAGNLYISDAANHRIRKINTNGIISTVAGNGVEGFSGDGGPATDAELRYPGGLSVDSNGNLFIADHSNNRIRKVDINGIITTVAGSGGVGIEGGGFSGDGGIASSAQLHEPMSVTVDSVGNLYIADSWNHRIRKVDTAGIISTVAGSGDGSSDGGFGGFSGDDGPAVVAQLKCPYDVSVDGAGNVYIADTGNYRIRKVDTAGIISTIAGNGSFGSFGVH